MPAQPFACSLVVTLAFLCSVAAHAEQIVEPATQRGFASRLIDNGHKLTLLGVGARKKLFVKVYAMALYVDETEARRAFPALAVRAGGRDHAKLTSSDHAQSFVLWGTFTKMAILHFVHDVDAAKLKESFSEGLAEELAATAPADVRAAAQSFVALFDTDCKVGDEIVLRAAADTTLSVEVGGKIKSGPQNGKLARAVWSVWLGAKPISTDLRHDLVNRIDLLGQ